MFLLYFHDLFYCMEQENSDTWCVKAYSLSGYRGRGDEALSLCIVSTSAEIKPFPTRRSHSGTKPPLVQRRMKNLSSRLCKEISANRSELAIPCVTVHRSVNHVWWPIWRYSGDLDPGLPHSVHDLLVQWDGHRYAGASRPTGGS